MVIREMEGCISDVVNYNQQRLKVIRMFDISISNIMQELKTLGVEDVKAIKKEDNSYTVSISKMEANVSFDDIRSLFVSLMSQDHKEVSLRSFLELKQEDVDNLIKRLFFKKLGPGDALGYKMHGSDFYFNG